MFHCNVVKHQDCYQVLVINLSSQVLDTKALKYDSHQGFTKKDQIHQIRVEP